MRLNFSILFFAVLFSTFACKSKKNAAGLGTKDVMYSIKKGACFGQCPVYSMTIDGKGLAKLDARRFNKINGKLERTLSKEELAVLEMAFKAANLGGMNAEYPMAVEDLATIVVGHNIDGTLKTVKGNESMPDSYIRIVALMDGISRSEGWTVIEKYPELESDNARAVQETKPKEDNNIYEEIIMEPNPGVRLPIWFKEKQAISVRLLKKVDTNSNLWLITYDKNLYEPNVMLDMLRKDPDVKFAEFNKKVSERGN